MTGREMWEAFTRANPACAGEAYEAWQYGCAPDLLAELTLSGVKTATASALPAYEHEGCAIPRAGNFSVILNARDEAVCVIRTSRVTVTPFRDVEARHAYWEGEGDRSLKSWRAVHADVFAKELAAFGQTFTEDMPVVCEEFERAYP